MAISAAALEGALRGAWAVHRTRQALPGGDWYRRWPSSHVVFGASRWQLLWTGFERRFGGCGVSEGTWSVITVGTGALLVLTVKAWRPSRFHELGIELNHGYDGGDMVVAAAEAQFEREARRRRDGQVRMYFLPLELHDRAIVMALPSDGRSTPTQRWTRAEITWPRPGVGREMRAAPAPGESPRWRPRLRSGVPLMTGRRGAPPVPASGGRTRTARESLVGTGRNSAL